jgi:hypothetical protein
MNRGYLQIASYVVSKDKDGKDHVKERHLRAMTDEDGHVKGKFYEKEKAPGEKAKIIEKNIRSEKDLKKYINGGSKDWERKDWEKRVEKNKARALREKK